MQSGVIKGRNPKRIREKVQNRRRVGNRKREEVASLSRKIISMKSSKKTGRGGERSPALERTCFRKISVSRRYSAKIGSWRRYPRTSFFPSASPPLLDLIIGSVQLPCLNVERTATRPPIFELQLMGITFLINEGRCSHVVSIRAADTWGKKGS